jgi:hypothetical protein
VAVAASGRSRPASLAVVAGHPRWRLRPGVRDALLGNPALPEETAEALLAGATDRELASLSARPGSPPPLRAAAERVLAQRTQPE